MSGIARIHITDAFTGSGRGRLDQARETEPVADELYRIIFDHIGMPLQPGTDVIECTRSEFMAGYDYELGIDVNLRFMSDQTATLQEKFLNFDQYTLTVEYMQDWRTGIRGDWFKLKAQYYFCGYPNRDRTEFKDGVLVNWTSLQSATSQGRIRWYENKNKADGARASFRWVPFDKIPADVLVYRHRIKPLQGLLLG